MLMNYWYAIEHASHVQEGVPFPIRALGEDLVLWRTSDGGMVAQSDLCVHRGAMLSGGEIIDDCLVCPYHGWEYNTAGKCEKIPANMDQTRIPKKAQIDTYPCVEKYGFVWVFLGDLPEDQRPPLPQLPLDDAKGAQLEGWTPTEGRFHWDANYERVIENAIDIAHAPFVHRNTFGNPDKPQVEEYGVDEDGRSAFAVVELDPPPAKGLWGRMRGKERPKVWSKTGLFFPNVTMLNIRLPMGEFMLFTAAVPIDDNHTVSKFINVRNFFTGGWADRDSIKRTLKIFEEDEPQVLGQRPELVPFDLQAELHVKSDALQLAYRRWRQEGHDRGWGIETHRFMTHKEMKTVIPSPARRENPELANAWVMKEAPLRPPKTKTMDETTVPNTPSGVTE